MADEVIRLGFEDSQLIAAKNRANQALDSFERKAATANANTQKAFDRTFSQGEQKVVRFSQTSASAIERIAKSAEQKAAMFGKTGVDRLVAERDQIIGRLAGEEKAIERVRASYDKMIAVERSAVESKRNLGSAIRNFVQNPIQAAGDAVSGFVEKLGPMGAKLLALGTVGGAVAAKTYGLIQQFAAGAEKIANLAEQTGLTIREAEQFSAAARMAGIDVSVLVQGARRLAEAMEESSEEGEKGRRWLQRLGIDARDSNRQLKPTGELIREIGEAISGLSDPAAKLRAVSGLFGRGGVTLLPVFAELPETLRHLEQIGVGMDEAVIKRLERADKVLDRFKERWELFWKESAAHAVKFGEMFSPTLAGRKPEEHSILKNLAAFVWSGGTRTTWPSRIAPEGPYGPPLPPPDTKAWEIYMSSIGGEAGIRAKLDKERAALRLAIEEKDIAEHRAATARIQALEKQLELLGKVKRETEALAEINEKLRAATATWATGAAAYYTVGKSRYAYTPPGVAESRAASLGDWIEAERAQAAMRESWRSPLGAKAAGEIRAAGVVEFAAAAGENWQRAEREKLASLNRELQTRERLIALAAGPGGELETAEKLYQLRAQFAAEELGITRDKERYLDRMHAAEMDRLDEIMRTERRRFDDLKHSVEGLFDAMLSRSRSLGDAIWRMFQTAALTPVKEGFSNWMAGLLYGRTPSFGAGTAALGLGMPSFGSAGPLANIGALVGGPGGTSGFAGPVGGHGGFGSAYGLAALGALKGMLFNTGSIAMGGGMATTAAGIGGAGGALAGFASSPAGMMGGGLLAMYGLKRGGLMGALMSTGGGALAGFGVGASIGAIGGPLGMAIGAGVGAAAGFIRSLFKSAEDKLREKIRALYAIDVQDKGILRMFLDTIRASFGGNIDLGIRSPQIRDLIELYGISTGQKGQGFPGEMRGLAVTQISGRAYELPSYRHGTALSAITRMPAAPPEQAISIVSHFTMPAEAVNDAFNGRTQTFISRHPREIQASISDALRANFGRREMTAQLLAPTTVLS